MARGRIRYILRSWIRPNSGWSVWHTLVGCPFFGRIWRLGLHNCMLLASVVVTFRFPFGFSSIRYVFPVYYV